jgi:phage shock protein A
MALMERVAALLRANVNDLIDRAEDPEKMLAQLIRDLDNQLLQLKTQLAITIADRHVLLAKQKAEVDGGKNWREKASAAMASGKEDMARLALERAVMHEAMAQDLVSVVAEQSDEVESLRTSYNQLESQRKHANHYVVMLTAQLRRAKISGKAITARQAADAIALTLRDGPQLDRLKERIQLQEGKNAAGKELMEPEYLEGQFADMERERKVDQLLKELKLTHGMLETG